MSRDENRMKWSKIIDKQSASGLTQKAWCEENKINLHNFRYWRSRIEKTVTESNSIDFVSIKPQQVHRGKKGISLRIGSATMDLADDVNLETLNNVIQVLMRYV